MPNCSRLLTVDENVQVDGEGGGDAFGGGDFVQQRAEPPFWLQEEA